MKTLRNVKYAAERMAIREHRVYDLVRKNYFPLGVVVRIGQRQIRFDEDALNRWIELGGGRANGDLPVTSSPDIEGS